jgi:hypothetical protein
MKKRRNPQTLIELALGEITVQSYRTLELKGGKAYRRCKIKDGEEIANFFLDRSNLPGNYGETVIFRCFVNLWENNRLSIAHFPISYLPLKLSNDIYEVCLTIMFQLSEDVGFGFPCKKQCLCAKDLKDCMCFINTRKENNYDDVAFKSGRGVYVRVVSNNLQKFG